MKYLLINPPSPFLLDEFVMPPLGLCYLSSTLKKAGHEVEYLDLGGTIFITPVVAIALSDAKADVFGITSTTPQYGFAVNILRHLKKDNPGCRVIIGGPHATVAFWECYQDGFDAVVIGEGERSILDSLIMTYKGRYICENPPIQELDALPFPDRSFIEDYFYYLGGRRTTTMMTSRGCPYGCAFCVKNWPREVRYRSPRNVLREAGEIKKLGFGGVMLYDDELLMDWERDKEIFMGLGKLDLIYRIFTRANLVNEGRARVLASTGCYEVLIGCESGSDKILGNIKKGTTREQNIKAVKALKQAGIRAKAALIVGLPGETPDTVRETETFCEEAQPDDIDFTIFTPYPGSDIYKNPGLYDIEFTPVQNVPYKTVPGKYVSAVRTSAMTAEDIVAARDYLEAKYKPEMGGGAHK